MAWADLPLDLVGDVMAYLPLPADRARLAAVCGAWRSAARQLAASGRMPWILLPSGGVCTTIGHDAAFFRIPGLPEKTTCLGGATGTDAWLALDCTDDTCRRTPFWDNYCPDTGTFKDDPRPDVKHRHTYLLYNLFSNVTVPLPELDAIIGYVTETFEVRKVLMVMPSSSSSTPDDNDAVVIAVTTNHCDYNVILCRPGKGAFVLPYYKVIDIAFVGDILYGITTSEELLAFHLGEDEDGRPNITRFERAINSPLSLDDYDESDDDDDDDEEEEEEEEEDDHNESNDDDHESDDNDNDDDDDDNDDDDNDNDDGDDDDEEEEGNSSIDESDDDDGAAANQAWHDDDDDGCTVSDNEETEGYEYNEEPKDMICTSRYLVQSCSGELLLVRHQSLIPMDSHSYTLKVEVFKADFCTGKWVCCSNGLPKGEALFLSRSVSKCTRVCGDIQEGFVYCISNLQDVFDTTSSTTRPMTFQWPCQRIRRESHHFLSWFFPPKELLV